MRMYVHIPNKTLIIGLNWVVFESFLSNTHGTTDAKLIIDLRDYNWFNALHMDKKAIHCRLNGQKCKK